MQALPFHPNSKIHDHDTCIQHNIHRPRDKHVFAKNCVRFDIPRIVNNCPNSILNKINTDSIQDYSGYIKHMFYKLTRKPALWWTVI